MAPYTEQILVIPSADGTPIHASLLGSPLLPALVLVHGQSMSSIVFDSIFSAPEYLEHLCLVRYDVRGHGRSGRPPNEQKGGDLAAWFAGERLAEDFDAVVGAFGLRDVFLAPWSVGGAILMDVLTYSRIPLRGAILISAVPSMSSVPYVATPEILHLLSSGLLSTDDVALANRTMLATLDMCVANPVKLPHRLKSMWAGDAMGQAPTVKGAYLTRKQDQGTFVAMGEEGCEILVLHGEKDTQIDGEKTFEVLKGHFGKRVSKCFLEGVGHAPFLEAPGKFREAVVGFVRRADKTV